MDIAVERVTEPTDDARLLVGELEAALAAEYLPEQRHGLALEALFQPEVLFFLARGDARPVGCAGVALFAGFAEVKRMYVRPGARGRGVAEALLSRIETVTRESGRDRLCLETGDRQAAAIRFYVRQGFTRCPVFGGYAAMPASSVVTSVFFEKWLVGRTG